MTDRIEQLESNVLNVKADNETALQMDIGTGSAYFKGDITGREPQI